jgi:hypothetical protein
VTGASLAPEVVPALVPGVIETHGVIETFGAFWAYGVCGE